MLSFQKLKYTPHCTFSPKFLSSMEDFHSNAPSHNACETNGNTSYNSEAPAPEFSPSAGGSNNGAKYRLLSPAKLPISRSACMNIPPGLSPTSFLESPVLLSNIKVEPSPTTGSFFNTHLMQGSGKNAAELSLEKDYSVGNNTIDERTPNNFEFKFHTGSGLSSAGMAIPAGFKRNFPFSETQDPRFSQSPTHEQPSTKEFRIPAPMSMHESPISSTIDELNQGGQVNNSGEQSSPSDHKDSVSIVTAERTSDDGYNWRKYGQKLVKGSEFPRSYYKCTYPNCEVKKIFERSPSGQITEIVYKGSHDHPKPQAARRNNPGAIVSFQEENSDKDFSFTGQDDKLNMEPNASPVLSPRQANENGLNGSNSQFQVSNDAIDEEDSLLKRRRMEDGLDVTPVVKPIREPRVVVQTVSEVDILDDGYRWRKYGQKVVRGNPNPRSYYKCTFVACPVRKHVERASHDPKAVITTYEGKHNHDVPNSKNTTHEFTPTNTPPYTIANSKTRPEENHSVSLDLGVGIARDNTTNEQLQITKNNSNMMVVGASTQIPACYNNGGLNVYGNRENHVSEY